MEVLVQVGLHILTEIFKRWKLNFYFKVTLNVIIGLTKGLNCTSNCYLKVIEFEFTPRCCVNQTVDYIIKTLSGTYQRGTCISFPGSFSLSVCLFPCNSKFHFNPRYTLSSALKYSQHFPSGVFVLNLCRLDLEPSRIQNEAVPVRHLGEAVDPLKWVF